MIYLFLPFNRLIRGISLWYVHLDSVSMTCITSFNWQLSFSYIFCHVSNCYAKSTRGQTEQMLLLAAANPYRTSVSLPYSFCESELKGAQTSCSRHLSDLDLTSGEPPKFHEFALKMLLSQQTTTMTEPNPGRQCFARHVLKGILGPTAPKTQSTQNTFWNLPNPLQAMRSALPSTRRSLCCQSVSCKHLCTIN